MAEHFINNLLNSLRISDRVRIVILIDLIVIFAWFFYELLDKSKRNLIICLLSETIFWVVIVVVSLIIYFIAPLILRQETASKEAAVHGSTTNKFSIKSFLGRVSIFIKHSYLIFFYGLIVGIIIISATDYLSQKGNFIGDISSPPLGYTIESYGEIHIIGRTKNIPSDFTVWIILENNNQMFPVKLKDSFPKIDNLSGIKANCSFEGKLNMNDILSYPYPIQLFISLCAIDHSGNEQISFWIKEYRPKTLIEPGLYRIVNKVKLDNVVINIK
jgi:hypothetical protein